MVLKVLVNGFSWCSEFFMFVVCSCFLVDSVVVCVVVVSRVMVVWVCCLLVSGVVVV